MDIYVGTVLLDKDNKIYLIKSRDKNNISKQRWNLPGGSLEPGEDLASAAARETLEETGYSTQIQSLVGLYLCKKGNSRWLYIVFSTRPTDLERKPPDSEIKEGEWFGKEEFMKMDVSKLVHPDMHLVYKIATEGEGLSTSSIKYIDYTKLQGKHGQAGATLG